MEVAIFVGIIKLRLQRILEIEVHIKSMTYQRSKINDNEHILSNKDSSPNSYSKIDNFDYKHLIYMFQIFYSVSDSSENWKYI